MPLDQRQMDSELRAEGTDHLMLDKKLSHHPQDQLIQLLSGWTEPLGYRILHAEIQTHRQKVLRIFIDHLSPGQGIGIEDCVKVSRALDEPLETNAEVAELLPGNYELEVSSPGINRPLRTPEDFKAYAESRVRIHTFRPLSRTELNNAEYFDRHPKQKNFLGILKGVREGQVLLSVLSTGEENPVLTLPFPLISKANLEPEIDLEGKHDRE